MRQAKDGGEQLLSHRKLDALLLIARAVAAAVLEWVLLTLLEKAELLRALNFSLGDTIIITPWSVIPGFIFGVIVAGFLLRRKRRFGWGRWVAYILCSAASYFVAFQIAYNLAFAILISGILAGLAGSLIFSAATVWLLKASARQALLLPVIVGTAAGALLFVIFIPGEWRFGTLLFYALWQSAYSASLLPILSPRGQSEAVMRHWGTLVTALYILLVVSLAVMLWPLLAGAPVSVIGEVVPAVLFLTVLFATSPLVLLFVGVDTSRRRPTPQRAVLITAGAAGFAMGLLALASGAALWEGIAGEDEQNPFGVLLALGAAMWIFWALLFWQFGDRILDRKGPVYRALIAGSVLELLVALPCHVIARQQQYCCAGVLTGFGIATGIAILFASLGPAALFLYRARLERIRRPELRRPVGPKGSLRTR